MKKTLLILAIFLMMTAAIAQPFKFVLVTDTHVGGSTGTEDLEKTVNDINGLKEIDFVILSGDVTEFGSEKELIEAKQILAQLKIPCYVLPGNHDSKWSESGNNDFVTFRNNSGGVVGRIEGQTLAELNADSDYINEKNAFIFDVVTSSVDLAIAGFEVAQGVVDVIAAASSSTACVGLGVCVTAPIPSFIIAAGASLVLKIANAASEATSLAGAIVYRDTYVSNRESQIGVTYQS